MNTGILILFLASCAVAQEAADARVAAACGLDRVNFDVKTQKNPHQSAQPDAAKALVYAIEDDTRFSTFPKPTVRVGLDGEWVGATHGNSYLSFSVTAGEHHLCASWQDWFSITALPIEGGTRNAALQLNAAAGGVYYVRIKDVFFQNESSTRATIDMQPVEADEGKLLAGTYSLATSQKK